jgi:hypothetical protein
LNLTLRGVGPSEPRSITYAFSLASKLGVADSGVRRVLRRLLSTRLRQYHKRNATNEMTANPPTTLPATTAVEAPLLAPWLLGTKLIAGVSEPVAAEPGAAVFVAKPIVVMSGRPLVEAAPWTSLWAIAVFADEAGKAILLSV